MDLNKLHETEKLKRPSNALSLFNTFSLSLLAQQKYMTLLYDNTGRCFYAANVDNHAYRELVEFAASSPLSACYRVPEGVSLGSLFNTKTVETLFFPGVPEETAAWVKKLLGPVPALSFRSRNIMEERFPGNAFVMGTPLSNLFLFRLSEDVFLGIISLSELFSRLSELSGRLVLISGARREILGLSRALVSLFGIPDPERLLRAPVADLLDLDSGTPGLVRRDLKTRAEWHSPAEIRKTFRILAQSAHRETGPEGEEFIVDNRKTRSFSWIIPDTKEVFGGSAFEFSVEFFSGETCGPPNFVLNADLASLESSARFPDISGYNLAFDHQDLSLVLKKAGTPVREFLKTELKDNAWNNLLIRKSGDALEWLMNGVSIGTYTEYSPFPDAAGAPVIVFIRPGSRVRLRGLVYRSAAEQVKPGDNRRTIAVAGNHRLAIVSRSMLRGPEPVEIIEFADVTLIEERIRDLEKEKASLLSLLKPETGPVAASVPMAALFAELPRVARSGITVLIEGETGTGKEVIAKALHEASERKDGPFVKIDCMTIPETLMEAELFGYEKGAFTGATAAREGRFQQARGGTVFLDEIAGIPMSTQAKLLNVLQDRQVRRLGGDRAEDLDIRIIAASNRPLDALVSQGRFREDLFYRLNQVRLRLPPLRTRFEDIPLLTQRFVGEGNRLYAKAVKGLSPAALKKVLAHDWPGNVRELRNTILRAVLLSSSRTIGEEDISVEPALSAAPDFNQAAGKRRRPSRDAFSALLFQEHGNLSEAAKRMGMGRQSVYRYLKKFKLNPALFRAWK